MTIREAWGAFRQERAVALCETTVACTYQQVSHWVERCPIEELGRGREAILWVLQQEPKGAARKVAAYLKSMYRWAASEDVALIERNPVASLMLPKMPQAQSDTQVIPADEIDEVMFALRYGRGAAVPWHLWAQFQLQTGLRTGEVRALQWGDVGEQAISVHANWTQTHGYKTSTKTSKRRTVPLNPVARGILESLPRTDSFVFPWDRNSFRSFFSDCMRDAHSQGFISARFRPYDLRHTAISRWLEQGVSVAQAAAWAGNSPKVLMQHYCGVSQPYEMPTI